MNMQIIAREGVPEYAVIPWSEYQALRAQLEWSQDLRDAMQVSQSIEAGNGRETL